MNHPESHRHPAVDPHKWTTKVNIAMVISAAAILVLGFLFALWVGANRGEVRDEMDEDLGRESRHHLHHVSHFQSA